VIKITNQSTSFLSKESFSFFPVFCHMVQKVSLIDSVAEECSYAVRTGDLGVLTHVPSCELNNTGAICYRASQPLLSIGLSS
jgi:hypothetical protein